MTPIRGFFRRFRGQPDERSAPEADTPRAADRSGSREASGVSSTPDHGAPSDDGGSKRRRGRRGGRGRRRNGAADQPPAGEQQRTEPPTPSPSNTPTASDASSNSSRNGRGSRGGRQRSGSDRSGDNRPAGDDRREYRWGRRVPEDEAREIVEKRVEQAQRRRRTARRGQLDAPLPEDIAFRAAAEGGDRSILPARRRRPDGLRETERVMVAGPRSLSGWSRWETTTETEPPPAERAPQEAEPAAEEDAPTPDAENMRPSDGLADDDERTAGIDVAETAEVGAEGAEGAEDDDEATSRPRRRGRRGGRGRRRSSDEPAENGARAEHESDDADPDDDEESATQPTAEVEDEPADPEDRQTARRERSSARDKRSTAELPAAFAALGMSERSLGSMAESGFTEPTPIQARAIPALLNGLDVVGVAQTGSGKTVAFGVPMMERLDPQLDEVQGIVLVPTRELAQQVLEVLTDLGRPWGLETVGLLGGRRLEGDFRALKAKPHIVVGTPGRIIDHLNRGTLSLRHVSYAVLDEADQMLDIGFMPDIRRILSRTPKRRQTALFSATMPTTIRRLVWQFMDDPETVSVDPELSTVDSIEQIYMEVAQRDKVRGLRELIERELKGRTLVFSRTKRGVDHLERQLGSEGVRVGALHGDMDQRRRDRVVQDFREGKLDILIATNVAARGLDIPEITHVVNYDVPQNAEEYVHRIGRTGRAGRDGKAITFVSEWDVQDFDSIREEFSEQLRQERLDLYAAGGSGNR